jgi:hypothetical protein
MKIALQIGEAEPSTDLMMDATSYPMAQKRAHAGYGNSEPCDDQGRIVRVDDNVMAKCDQFACEIERIEAAMDHNIDFSRNHGQLSRWPKSP